MTTLPPSDSHDQPLAYQVWCQDRSYLEEPAQTKLVAACRYLMSAIDYAADLARNGVRCVLTGPYRMATEYTKDEAAGCGYSIREARADDSGHR